MLTSHDYTRCQYHSSCRYNGVSSSLLQTVTHHQTLTKPRFDRCAVGGLDEGEVPLNDQDHRIAILVSLILSPQTKDTVTFPAVQALRKKLPGGLTLQGLLDAEEEEIDKLICKVGFHQKKAGYLKSMAKRVRNLHDSEVPSDLRSSFLSSSSSVGAAY